MDKRNAVEGLFQDIMNASSEKDLEILEQLLSGVKRKLQEPQTTYISELLQMERTVDQHRCIMTIPINELTENTAHILHGGMTATLLDTAMGTLANDVLPEDMGAVTSNLNIYYIAPGIGKSIKVIAEIIHKGTQTIVLEASAFRDDEVKIAHCTSTFHIIKRKK
ncbi:PaaI family thioesterase [Pullulanibacillus pueri]|uniref:Thioesterase domain-containing protein n=1 Tax=Pullulanibacillus pueri TaxID=1437324 RepID=A0A8J2ZUF4_9BACL|nr:PaaI family thioesterase [Pullulanibacillus pueri]GGH78431.1 hypothetical protein GCM10007096_11840 [Pullulanibacillus pueri]